MTDIQVLSHMYPGYGSARGGYHVRVVYKNKLLDEERGGESEIEMGRCEARMEAKWFGKTNRELDQIAGGKELASPLCSNCGQPTEGGGSTCLDKTWCNRPKCREALDAAIVEYREAAARNTAEFEEKVAEKHLARLRHAEEVTVGFHWRDGWYFRRLEDGSVGIARRNAPTSEWLDADLIIPPNEWASIVASMSAVGETSQTFRAALDRQLTPSASINTDGETNG